MLKQTNVRGSALTFLLVWAVAAVHNAGQVVV